MSLFEREDSLAGGFQGHSVPQHFLATSVVAVQVQMPISNCFEGLKNAEQIRKTRNAELRLCILKELGKVLIISALSDEKSRRLLLLCPFAHI